ncbi:hypothetical protein SAMN05428981_1011265 [Bacillus sp. OV194]|nr:hypothetical protein SAMN05428981_1011265 [Bacillus sp. OV194]
MNTGDIIVQLMFVVFFAFLITMVVLLFRSQSNRNKQQNNIESKIDEVSSKMNTGNNLTLTNRGCKRN